MSSIPGEQATVHTVRPDGGVSVVRDDGVLIKVPPAAVAAGGWLSPRPGQRVTLQRDGEIILAMLMPTEPG